MTDTTTTEHVTDCLHDLADGECHVERWAKVPDHLVALARRHAPDAPECVINRMAELAADAYARGYVDAVEQTGTNNP